MVWLAGTAAAIQVHRRDIELSPWPGAGTEWKRPRTRRTRTVTRAVSDHRRSRARSGGARPGGIVITDISKLLSIGPVVLLVNIETNMCNIENPNLNWILKDIVWNTTQSYLCNAKVNSIPLLETVKDVN